MIARAIALDKQGVYSMVGGELIDRYGFAVKIAEAFGLDAGLIEPVTSDQLQQTARRPLRAGLTMERTTRELGVQALDVEEGLRVLKTQMIAKEEVGGRGDTAAKDPG
jgi:dTDP-4-dehydrorhamnose reductase